MAKKNCIGQTLLSQGVITNEQLELCLNVMNNPGNTKRLGHYLKLYNFIDESHITKYLASNYHYKYFEDEYIPDHSVLKQFDLKYWQKHVVYPLKNGSEYSFVLAYVDNNKVKSEIEAAFLGSKISFYLGNESDVKNALNRLDVELERKKYEESDKKKSKFDKDEDESYLRNIIIELITKAVCTKSTDIHIEPSEVGIDIFLRIDGKCKYLYCFEKKHIKGFFNVICNLSDYDCSKILEFNDMRFKYQINEDQVEFRVSTAPSVHGPKICIRVLDKTKATYKLSDLGYANENLDKIEYAIKNPNGFNLVIGPTGSGKTTTLYSIINKIKCIEKKTVSIEDPIEMDFSLVTQVEINKARNITFSNAIRSFLRLDPDIILVGEIRDKETALEAVNASLTGHQVFSTLHAKDPISAITRLKEFISDPTQISNSLHSIISQRLVRKLCKHCYKESIQNAQRKDFSRSQQRFFLHENQNIYLNVGCPKCDGQGYLGRVVVSEVLVMDDVILSCIESNDLAKLRQHLKDINHKTLLDNAKELIFEGITTIEEAEGVVN